uniref:CSON002962 protein n=1 Tax=Culicoides sonorensis TaxID=179676 RepID=A0A336MKT0_CULSO
MMFDTIFTQCLIHCCLTMCITTIGRLIFDTGCCLKCSKEKPYSIATQRTFDPFNCLIHIKNNSKKKIRRLTIQLCKTNTGYHLRPIKPPNDNGYKMDFDDIQDSDGTIVEFKGTSWYKIEIKPQKVFSFELKYVPETKSEDVMLKERCIICYVNKNCEDRDMEAIATGDHTGLRVSRFIKMSDW